MVKVILLPVRLVYRGVKLKDLIAICLYSIVAWLAVRTEAKGFSGTRAFHGNGLINVKVIHLKMEKEK